MSVSLVMLPFGLAMYAIMGKENFESFANSMKLPFRTNFKHDEELVRTVRGAGYDVRNFFGLFKTHAKGRINFFTWEYIDGRWCAVFTKSDDPAEIEKFIKDIEEKAGRSIFFKDADCAQHKAVKSSTFPTNFRDADLLMQTLRSYEGSPLELPGGGIRCTMNGVDMTFTPGAQDTPFSIAFKTLPDRAAFDCLNRIDDQYKQRVQELTCERIRERAHQHNLTVESEEVLEDKSIVITLTVD
jgi:hypothetical protein